MVHRKTGVAGQQTPTVRRIGRRGISVLSVAIIAALMVASSGATVGTAAQAATVGPPQPTVPSPFTPVSAEFVPPEFAVFGEALTALIDVPGSAEKEPIVVLKPLNHKPAKPYKVVLFAHGAGDDRLAVMNSKAFVINQALLAEGFMVIAGDFGGKYSYGNQYAVDRVSAAVAFLNTQFKVSDVVIEGVSMGGLVGLNAIMRGKIPNLRGWIGISPVCNLEAALASEYLSEGANMAYGTSPQDVRDKFDPAKALRGYKLKGLPMRFLASQQDVVVPEAVHTGACVPKFKRAGANVKTSSVPGEHGSLRNFRAAPVLKFVRGVTNRVPAVPKKPLRHS